MQQQPQTMALPNDTRKAMLGRIQQTIKSAVIATGRGVEEVHKYAMNIEITAMKQANGDLVSIITAARPGVTVQTLFLLSVHGAG